MIRRPSPNFDARPVGGPIDMLVLHYTGMESAKAALDRLCDRATKVSAHYLIDEDGSITAMVDESDRAWHAGVSCWRGNRDVNARSIGIELVNPGHDNGYRAFPEAQMAALEKLAAEILARHPIPPRNVVAHSDVAPIRKIDPGELFDWRRLALRGIGVWPTPAAGQRDGLTQALAAYGYDVTDAKAAVSAFQRRFRPACFDGVADDETTALAVGLLQKI
jgi:N-acetylmuramoyl-L-alanine amidase